MYDYDTLIDKITKSFFLNKKDLAKVLGCSPQNIDHKMQFLPKELPKWEKRGGKKQSKVFFRRDEVIKFLKEKL